jgi:hypothetical protein
MNIPSNFVRNLFIQSLKVTNMATVLIIQVVSDEFSGTSKYSY